MTIALHAAHHDDPVGPVFKGLQQVDDVHLAGAGDLDDPHVGRVLQSHRTCQVRGGIRSVMAAKPDDFRLKRFHHWAPLISISVCAQVAACGTPGSKPAWTPQYKVFDLGADLVILIMRHLDHLGRAFRGAGAAALAQGLVDLRDVFPVDLGHAVGTGADAHQAGGAAVRRPRGR